ncbi:MAG: hypothetical protein HFE86_00835 [Clostridiales bacterium]|nr:hypothetical protein [Clostridiales bacterium]
MQKKFLSLALAGALGLSTLGGLPVLTAAGEDDALSPADYLKQTETGYSLSSLDRSMRFNLFQQEGQLMYSVERQTAGGRIQVGDLDKNGQVNISDVMEACKVLARQSAGTAPSEFEMAAGNLDGDDRFTITDVMELCKMLARNSEPVYKETGASIPLIQPSKLGVTIDGAAYGSDVRFQEAEASLIESRVIPLLGNQTQIQDEGVTASFTLQQGEDSFYLDVRAYDDGVAFRYRFPGSDETRRTVADELTQFVLPSSLREVWAGKDNRDSEPEIEKLNPAQAVSRHINIPLTAVLAEGEGYLSIMEGGASTSFPQINLDAKGGYTYQANTSWSDTKSYSTAGDIVTGWRIVNGADDLNALVNNYNIYKVNPDPDPDLYADQSYIQPGRATWTWLTDYGDPSCKDPKYSQQFMKAASKLGFEYSVIDEGWYFKGNTAWHDNSLQNETYVPALQKLGDTGKAVNVKPILWTGVTSDANRCLQVRDLASAKAFVDLMKKTGMAGAKIDFWAGEDNPQDRSLELQEAFLKFCAEEKLLVNFHGVNEPTGLSVTYPNEITREAVRGLENVGNASNRNYATQARFLTRQLFTRYLAGHADWTPACNTAMQIASLILIDSPLNVIATHPNDILSNPAVEMIKSIPTVWDQTLVLPVSEIDKLAVYAKQSKGSWYLGGIYHNEEDQQAQQIRFDYDFLDEGSYQMELWVDNEDGSKEKIEKTVTNQDSFRSLVPANAGFAARFTKLSASQYGGEILDGRPLTFTAADQKAVIKYTTDGSDPMTSPTALTYSQPIALEQSCKVRAAIVEGDGAGTAFAHQFNMGKPEVASDIVYGQSETTVTLSANMEADIYYTADGSEPSTDSAKYAAPLRFTEDCVLKILAVFRKDGTRVTDAIQIGIKNQPAIVPNVSLTDADYTDAKTGWDSIGVDKNCKNGPISINGIKYDRGVGVNANGYFEYNVPAGATYLVGTVGIDDAVKENVNDGHKASGNCVISFDGKEAWSSVVFRPDEHITFKVAVPAGAKTVRIDLLDGGDGITCDNISIGSAGWLGENIDMTQPEPLDPNAAYISDDMVVDRQSGLDGCIGLDGWQDGAPITVGDKLYSKGLANYTAVDGSAHFTVRIPDGAKRITGVGGVDTAACKRFCDDEGYLDQAKANFKFIFRDADSKELDVQTTANAGYGEELQIAYDIPENAATVEIQFLPGGRDNAGYGYASIGNLGFTSVTSDIIYISADMIIESQSGWGSYNTINVWPQGVAITIAEKTYASGLCNHSSPDGSAKFIVKLPAGVTRLTGVGGVDMAACKAFCDADGYLTQAKASFKFIFRDADGKELDAQTTKSVDYGQSVTISYAIPQNANTVEIQFLPGDRDNANFGYASIGDLCFLK